MQTLWLFIRNIFIQCWHILRFTRELIINLLIISIVIIILGYYISVYHKKSIPIKGALVMDISGNIVDKPSTNNRINQFSYDVLGISKNKMQENSLFNLINILRQAKNDPNITGLILLLKNFSGSDPTSLEYIGKTLQEFRNNKKPIYAIGKYYSQSQYFLASYANKIYMLPHGAVDIHGISTNTLYYKSFLNKLKINSHIFRVGTYKSAVEPFLRDNMSEEAKYAENHWIQQIWQNYLDIVSYNRQITTSTLFPEATIILNKLKIVDGDTAQYALQNKLVDMIAPNETIEKEMIQVFGFNKKNSSYNSISIYDYQLPTNNIGQEQKNQIAVIFANGYIIDGCDMQGAIGSDSIIDKIRNARLNPNIKAIILRVNSPGGSINATELISSEISLTRNKGKPIIVSMGGIAASGGYWISTPANTIIANKNTLTGSIGIFGIINTFEESLDIIGIHADGISTSPLADVSINKPLPNEYENIMQICINKGYQNFINIVSKYRNKSSTDVNEIAQGRVWSGADALKNGLIDKLGDFDDAIKIAAKLANITEYNLKWYIDEPNLIDLLLMQINTMINSAITTQIAHNLWYNNNILNDTPNIIDIIIGSQLKYPYNCYSICFSCNKI